MPSLPTKGSVMTLKTWARTRRCRFGLGVPLVLFAHAAVRGGVTLHELGRVHFHRAWAQAGKHVQQIVRPRACLRAREADGDEVGLLEGLLEGVVEFDGIELAVARFKVLHGEVVIDLDDLLDDLLVGLVDAGEVGLVARGVVAVVLKDVDDLRPVPRRQVDRQADRAERLADRRDQPRQVQVVLINLVDDDHPRDLAFRRHRHHAACHAVDALQGVDDHRDRLARGEARDGVPREVREARRVDQVDQMPLVIKVKNRRLQAVLVVLLFVGEVADGVALADRSHPLDRAGGEKQPLRERRLAGTASPYKTDVADVGCWAGGHKKLLARWRL